MEKTLQHSIVKQGLIILYYFSNRWYRKCLFTEGNIPALNTPTRLKASENIDETNTLDQEDQSCKHKDADNDGGNRLHQISKQSDRNKNLKNTD